MQNHPQITYITKKCAVCIYRKTWVVRWERKLCLFCSGNIITEKFRFVKCFLKVFSKKILWHINPETEKAAHNAEKKYLNNKHNLNADKKQRFFCFMSCLFHSEKSAECAAEKAVPQKTGFAYPEFVLFRSTLIFQKQAVCFYVYEKNVD